MARIRTVKPEFWSDEKLSPCDPITRFVFLGLIGMADDSGRLLDNVKIIDAFIFPNTSDTCREALATLSRLGRIRRGMTSSRQPVIQITNWTKHQKVDKPNYKAALPQLVNEEQLTEDSRLIRDSFATASRTDLRPTTYDHLPTTNDHKECLPLEDVTINGTPKNGKPHRNRHEYTPDFEAFWSAYPRVRKLKKLEAWKAWEKAIDIVDPEVIISSAREYAESPVGSGEFSLLPTTWLNGRCWQDDRESWNRLPSERKETSSDFFNRLLGDAK